MMFKVNSLFSYQTSSTTKNDQPRQYCWSNDTWPSSGLGRWGSCRWWSCRRRSTPWSTTSCRGDRSGLEQSFRPGISILIWQLFNKARPLKKVKYIDNFLNVVKFKGVQYGSTCIIFSRKTSKKLGVLTTYDSFHWALKNAGSSTLPDEFFKVNNFPKHLDLSFKIIRSSFSVWLSLK